MIQASTPGSFSAIVRMELHVAGQHIALAQMGGGELIFDYPVSVPAGTGQLVMHINETAHHWRVMLRPGSIPTCRVPADFEYLE